MKNENGIFFLDISVLQVWTVLVALMSIAWSLTVYHRSVRYAREDKEKVKWVGIVVAFCWQLMSACEYFSITNQF